MIELLLKKEVISPIFIVAIAVLFYLLIKQIIRKMFKASEKFGVHKKSITIMQLITQLIKYLIIIIAIMEILSVWGIDTKAMLASLGVVGVLAGLALQDILKDFLAGFAIIVNNEFDVGDIIKIGDFKGEVVELGLKNTKIRAYTGEVKIFANRNINEVINYSSQTSTCVVDIPVSYDIDVDEIERVLNEICEKLSKKTPYLLSDVTILGIEKFDDSSVIYRLSAECESTKDIMFRREIYRVVKKEFDKNNIEIPFSQVVVHNAK